MATYLIHSAKGSTWKKHKYIKIVNGRYIYPKKETETRDSVKTKLLPNERRVRNEEGTGYDAKIRGVPVDKQQTESYRFGESQIERDYKKAEKTVKSYTLTKKREAAEKERQKKIDARKIISVAAQRKLKITKPTTRYTSNPNIKYTNATSSNALKKSTSSNASRNLTGANKTTKITKSTTRYTSNPNIKYTNATSSNALKKSTSSNALKKSTSSNASRNLTGANKTTKYMIGTNKNYTNKSPGNLSGVTKKTRVSKKPTINTYTKNKNIYIPTIDPITSVKKDKKKKKKR